MAVWGGRGPWAEDGLAAFWLWPICSWARGLPCSQTRYTQTVGTELDFVLSAE